MMFVDVCGALAFSMHTSQRAVQALQWFATP